MKRDEIYYSGNEELFWKRDWVLFFWKRKFILETGLGFVILETAVSGNENLFWKQSWFLFFWKRAFP